MAIVQRATHYCYAHCVSTDTSGCPIPRDAAGRLSNYKKIARDSGLSHSHVSRVLRGKSVPSLFVAAVIAQAADVRLDHLYNYIINVTPIRRSSALRHPKKLKLLPGIEVDEVREGKERYLFP